MSCAGRRLGPGLRGAGVRGRLVILDHRDKPFSRRHLWHVSHCRAGRPVVRTSIHAHAPGRGPRGAAAPARGMAAHRELRRPRPVPRRELERDCCSALGRRPSRQRRVEVVRRRASAFLLPKATVTRVRTRSTDGNGIPERGGVVNPFSQRFSGSGRLLLGSVERGWGQHAAPAAKRGRTVLRPPEGGAHCPGADSRRHQAPGVLVCEVVVGFDVDVEIDDSQGLPGIPPRRRGRMKPWGVSLWGQGVVGPITYSTAPQWWVMPFPGPHGV